MYVNIQEKTCRDLPLSADHLTALTRQTFLVVKHKDGAVSVVPGETFTVVFVPYNTNRRLHSILGYGHSKNIFNPVLSRGRLRTCLHIPDRARPQTHTSSGPQRAQHVS